MGSVLFLPVLSCGNHINFPGLNLLYCKMIVIVYILLSKALLAFERVYRSYKGEGGPTELLIYFEALNSVKHKKIMYYLTFKWKMRRC